jgi:chromosome segregation ATPase
MIKRFLTLTLMIAAIAAAWQYQAIADWWFLRNYEPPAEIVELANRAQLNEISRRTFYLADPKIDDKLEFNTHCPIGEESLVLGCFTGKIYILRVERKELQKVMEVTAAHEMLHAVYYRFSASEKDTLNHQLDSFFATIDDKKLRDLIAQYEKNDPSSRHDEMHAIFATQIEKLSPELESHYKKYFKNRAAVVTAYKDYEAVFENYQKRIKQLEVDINSVRNQLSELEADLAAKRAEIETVNRQLERHRKNNDFDAYNALVPKQNRLVREYNGMVSTYRDLVTLYNAKVQEINKLALEQNELVDSLDSTRFEPL